MVELSSVLVLTFIIFVLWKNERANDKDKIPFDILERDKFIK